MTESAPLDLVLLCPLFFMPKMDPLEELGSIGSATKGFEVERPTVAACCIVEGLEGTVEFCTIDIGRFPAGEMLDAEAKRDSTFPMPCRDPDACDCREIEPRLLTSDSLMGSGERARPSCKSKPAAGEGSLGGVMGVSAAAAMFDWDGVRSLRRLVQLFFIDPRRESRAGLAEGEEGAEGM